MFILICLAIFFIVKLRSIFFHSMFGIAGLCCVLLVLIASGIIF